MPRARAAVPVPTLYGPVEDPTWLVVFRRQIVAAATHVRYNAVRMEPTWMILGHAAGVAATMAARERVGVQDVDVSALQRTLVAQKQLVRP